MKNQNIVSNSIGWFITFFVLLLASAYFSIRLISGIDPFEFDTLIYLVILKNFISNGHFYTPTVGSEFSSVCNGLFNCQTYPPEINGQMIYSQFAGEYTSGLILIFFPSIINKLIIYFVPVSYSIKYLIFLYSLSWGILYLLCNVIVIYSAGFTRINFYKYIALSLLSISLLIHAVSYGIIGELYSSTFISIAVIALFLSDTNKNKPYFYYILSLLLGLALEAKITSIIVVFGVFSLILYRNYLENKKLSGLFLICFLFIPKLIISIYIYISLGGDLFDFLRYLKSVSSVYAGNAQTGANWPKSRIVGILDHLLAGINRVVLITLLLGIIYYIFSIFKSIKEKYNEKYFYLAAIPLLFMALIYPFVFRFPYERIYSPFYVLIPLLFIPLMNNNFICSRRKVLVNYLIYGSISSLVVIAYLAKPLKFPIDFNNKRHEVPSFGANYPDVKFEQNTIFVVSDFFGMPWDLYIKTLFDKEYSPFSEYPVYSINSIKKSNLDNFQIYTLTSCRWGHCYQGKEIKIDVNRDLYLKCTLVEPENNNLIYSLYKCLTVSY